MTLKVIETEASSLSMTDKARLIDFLWDSLSPHEIKAREAAWASESERRIVAFEKGAIGARDAGEVLSDLRTGLRQ